MLTNFEESTLILGGSSSFLFSSETFLLQAFGEKGTLDVGTPAKPNIYYPSEPDRLSAVFQQLLKF